jgi:hypothetical protein
MLLWCAVKTMPHICYLIFRNTIIQNVLFRLGGRLCQLLQTRMYVHRGALLAHCSRVALSNGPQSRYTLAWRRRQSAQRNTVNPHLKRGIRSSKTAPSVNPRWTSLILYGINGDTGTRPWKVKLSKQNIINIQQTTWTNCNKINCNRKVY